MAARVALTAERYVERQQASREAKALDGLAEAIAADDFEIPPPVTEVVARGPGGHLPKMGAEVYELARQVYYEQHGTIADAARTILAAGVALGASHDQVRERLNTWWDREGWPKRPTKRAFQLRDASNSGGLHRGERICKGKAIGNGPTPKGTPCTHTALEGSDLCYFHDDSPEALANRQLQGRRLKAAQMWDEVPLEPFARWCQEQRRRLVAEARARGEHVDSKDQGWARLAASMRVDHSALHRLVHGTRLRDANRPKTTIKAGTVLRYLEPTEIAFRDIYDFDPPTNEANYNVCPNCGAYKTHESKTCRECFERAEYLANCTFVTGQGRTCPVKTKDPSGYCCKHRQQVERQEERRRNPKPKNYRKSALNGRLLAFAIDEHLRTPRAEWVAARLWVANIEGVRGLYKSRKGLAAQIVKEFRKKGLTNVPKRKAGFANEEAMRALLAELVAEHGALEWPSAPAPQGMQEIPFEPFRAWLEQRLSEVGTYKALAARTGIDDDSASKWIRRVGAKGANKRTIWKSTVDAALRRFGDGTTYDDLYRT